MRSISYRILLLSAIAAVLLSNGCEPDNPLRSNELIYTFYGVEADGSTLYEFGGDGNVKGPVGGAVNSEGTMSSLDYNAGQYYVLISDPASLVKLDSNLNAKAEIPLNGGSEGEIIYVNATTAIYHPTGSASLEVVDLYFEKTGQIYSLPFSPVYISPTASEFSGNRVFLMGPAGEFGYFDIRKYEYVGLGDNGLENAILIDRPLNKQIFAIGNSEVSITAIKYDSESGEEISRAVYQNAVIPGEEPKPLAGTWGGFNQGYFVTSDRMWLLQDLVPDFRIIATGVDYTELGVSSAIAKANKTSVGVSFLLRGAASHILSFRDGAVATAAPQPLARPFLSYEPID